MKSMASLEKKKIRCRNESVEEAEETIEEQEEEETIEEQMDDEEPAAEEDSQSDEMEVDMKTWTWVMKQVMSQKWEQQISLANRRRSAAFN